MVSHPKRPPSSNKSSPYHPILITLKNHSNIATHVLWFFPPSNHFIPLLPKYPQPVFLSSCQETKFHIHAESCAKVIVSYIYLRHLHYLPTHSDHQHRPADVSYLTPVPTVCSRYNDSTTGEITVYVPTESRIVPPSRPGPSSLLYSGF
jgi:hypothetical protein